MDTEDYILAGVGVVGAYLLYQALKPFVPQGNVVAQTYELPNNGGLAVKDQSTYKFLGKNYIQALPPSYYFSNAGNFVQGFNPFSSKNPFNISTRNLWTWFT